MKIPNGLAVVSAGIIYFSFIVAGSLVVPGAVDEFAQVVIWAPAKPKAGFGVVEPGGIERGRHADAVQVAGFF